MPLLIDHTMIIKAAIFATVMMVVGLKPTLHNSITSGGVCNQLGNDKYVQNNDPEASYSVTVNVLFIKPGQNNSESQKIVVIPAGGSYYLGCSAGVQAGVTYVYTVVGERKI